MELYLVFKLNNKELCSYTLKDTFEGELEDTLELLAYENNCDVKDIKIEKELR